MASSRFESAVGRWLGPVPWLIMLIMSLLVVTSLYLGSQSVLVTADLHSLELAQENTKMTARLLESKALQLETALTVLADSIAQSGNGDQLTKSKLIRLVGTLMQNSQASFLHVANTQGVVEISPGNPQWVGRNLKEWPLVKNVSPSSPVRGLTLIDGHVFATASIAIVHDDEEHGYFVAGSEVDSRFFEELKKFTGAQAGIFVNGKNVEGNLPAVFNNKIDLAAPSSMTEVGNTQYAAATNALEMTDDAQKALLVVGRPRNQAETSVLQIMLRHAVPLAIPYGLASLLVLLLGRSLVIAFQRSQVLQKRLETLLDATHSFGVEHEIERCTMKAVEVVRGQVSLGSSVSACLSLQNDLYGGKQLVLFEEKDGKLVSRWHDGDSKIAAACTPPNEKVSPHLEQGRLYIPLVYQGYVEGMLALDGLIQDKLREDEKQFLEILGSSLAIALAGILYAGELAEQSRVEAEEKASAEKERLRELLTMSSRISDKLNSPLGAVFIAVESLKNKLDSLDRGSLSHEKAVSEFMEYCERRISLLSDALRSLRGITQELADYREIADKIEATSVLMERPAPKEKR